MYYLYLVLKFTLHRCTGHTTLADKSFWILFFLWFCVVGVSPIILFCILFFLLKNTWSANCEKHILNKICKGLESLLHCSITFPDNLHWNFSFSSFGSCRSKSQGWEKEEKKIQVLDFISFCIETGPCAHPVIKYCQIWVRKCLFFKTSLHYFEKEWWDTPCWNWKVI